MVKNHPLPDGNKRTAYATMWMFIAINGSAWTLEDPDEIVPMIVRVASGEISTKELTEWISSNLIGIGGSPTAAPLPHHPACGSAPGGSKS